MRAGGSPTKTYEQTHLGAGDIQAQVLEVAGGWQVKQQFLVEQLVGLQARITYQLSPYVPFAAINVWCDVAACALYSV